jgi:hypothetical protein
MDPDARVLECKWGTGEEKEKNVVEYGSEYVSHAKRAHRLRP